MSDLVYYNWEWLHFYSVGKQRKKLQCWWKDVFIIFKIVFFLWCNVLNYLHDGMTELKAHFYCSEPLKSKHLILFALKMKTKRQYLNNQDDMKKVHTFQCKHIWSHQNNRCFLLEMPLCVTVLFLSCEYTTALLLPSWLPSKPAKCQQHCNSFSLWPRDVPHSPDPDYTWSKMSSSTIWLLIWAWIKLTWPSATKCSSETTNWKD